MASAVVFLVMSSFLVLTKTDYSYFQCIRPVLKKYAASIVGEKLREICGVCLDKITETYQDGRVKSSYLSIGCQPPQDNTGSIYCLITELVKLWVCEV